MQPFIYENNYLYLNLNKFFKNKKMEQQMTKRNNGIILIVIGGIAGLWNATRIPVLLREISKLPDPESTGHVVGIGLIFLAAIICLIYGIILYRRHKKQTESNI